MDCMEETNAREEPEVWVQVGEQKFWVSLSRDYREEVTG